MSSDTCTLCGRPLVAGVCPQGHPQRAARRRRRRRWKVPTFLAIVAVLLAVGAYAALIWYPLREAEETMVPASRQFAAAAGAVDRAVEAFPENGDPESLTEAGEVVAAADQARARLTRAQVRLEEHAPANIPLLSRLAPLRIAVETHTEMQEFHVSGLELVGNLEATARYLTQLAPTLPHLGNLQSLLDEAEIPDEVESATAAALPVAEQLLADVRSLSPPAEVGGTHASLLAIARSVRSSIEELAELGDQAEVPVARAVLEDIASQLRSFRQTATEAPSAALEGGLSEQMASVEAMREDIAGRLQRLRAEGVERLAIPAD